MNNSKKILGKIWGQRKFKIKSVILLEIMQAILKVMIIKMIIIFLFKKNEKNNKNLDYNIIIIKENLNLC